MFSGKITDIKFDSETNKHEITCYDMAWYICKNNITYNFEDVSVNDAITYVISELEIERYDYDEGLKGNGNIRIGNHLIKNQPANKVLMAICSEITKLKGIYYYIHMNQNGRVVISECDKYYSGITIQKSSATVVDGNLISYTISKSMQNMVNQIKLYSPEYELLDTFNTIGFNRRQFGIIQDTEMLDTGDDDSDAEDDDYKYVLLKGLRRVYGAMKNGQEEIDAIVWDFHDKDQGADLALYLSLLLGRTQKRSWGEIWHLYQILEMQSSVITPSTLEYLLQLMMLKIDIG